jgi:hypothetical protein
MCLWWDQKEYMRIVSIVTTVRLNGDVVFPIPVNGSGIALKAIPTRRRCCRHEVAESYCKLTKVCLSF